MTITIRKKLGPSGYIPKSEHDIKFDADGKEISRTPKPRATTFTLRPLTDLELMDVWPDTRIVHGKSITLTGVAARRILANGVIGWNNLLDENGKAIPFSVDALESFDEKLVTDLAWEILVRSTLTEDDRKNFESQSM